MVWKSFEEFKPWMFIKNWITTKWKWIKEKHFNESKQFKKWNVRILIKVKLVDQMNQF